MPFLIFLTEFERRASEHTKAEQRRLRAALTGTASEQKAADAEAARANPWPRGMFYGESSSNLADNTPEDAEE